MEIVGFILAFIIGITLGLVGAGGSILTITVFVYVLHISPILSTTYSLFIVGIASFVGSIDYFRKGLVDLQKGLFFSFPAFIMVFLMRKTIMPLIPEMVYQSPILTITKNLLVMVVFALLMIIASYSMIKGNNKSTDDNYKVSYWMIFLEGLLVGILTGFVGAGGGFMIIPAMVIFAKLPMKKAVGTSLLIITINSAFGAFGDISAGISLDWYFLTKFVACTIGGILFGGYLSKKIDGEKLKPAFGWFVLVIGCWIMVKELILN